MGHQIETFDMAVKAHSKQEIEANLNTYVSKATWQEGGGGLFRKIRWLDDKQYFGFAEASDAIQRLDRGDYDQLAVQYWAPAREVSILWQKAYDELLSAYADVLRYKQQQSQIGARALLQQAQHRLSRAQKQFRELNASSTLMWKIKIEFHM